MNLYEVEGEAFSESAGGKVVITSYVAANTPEGALAKYKDKYTTYEPVRVERIGPILI